MQWSFFFAHAGVKREYRRQAIFFKVFIEFGFKGKVKVHLRAME